MIFDPKIGTKTTPKRPKRGPKELPFSSSIYASILNRFWLHFGCLLGPFWHLKIILKSILFFLENYVEPTWFPRPSQEVPRPLQEAQRSTQDRTRTAQDRTKTAQDGPKPSQEAPNTPPRDHQGASKRPKTSYRGPKSHPITKNTCGWESVSTNISYLSLINLYLIN